jgi:hypothetical protein
MHSMMSAMTGYGYPNFVMTAYGCPDFVWYPDFVGVPISSADYTCWRGWSTENRLMLKPA